MEEHVGALWHRVITRAAQRHYPDAAVALAEIEKTAGLLFRAFGGDPGLRIAPAAAMRHGARRHWLARIAGLGERTALSCRDAETLQLPPELALPPRRELNRDLYLWLIALAAAHDEVDSSAPRWRQNQQGTLIALDRYPGLRSRYQRLVTSVLDIRIPPERLPPDEVAQETRFRQALRDPGSLIEPPAARRPPQPVPLWLYPAPARPTPPPNRKSIGNPTSGGGKPAERDRQRRRAEHVDLPERKNSFLAPFRAESLLSWAEFVRVNRPTDEVRYTAGLLSRQTAARRLLVLPTDGKPNDLDQYEGRYGIEDTRMALLEARRQGLHPFCATIDQEADDYLPYRFLARTASS